MPDEERGEGKNHGGESPPKRATGIQARPKNWLVPVILLSLREWNSYGYRLMEQAAAFGFGATNPGTLYRTLRSMEKDGLCESKWNTDKGGRARREYSITDVGEAYLDFWAKSLEAYQRNLDTFFRIYTGTPARRDRHRDDG